MILNIFRLAVFQKLSFSDLKSVRKLCFKKYLHTCGPSLTLHLPAAASSCTPAAHPPISTRQSTAPDPHPSLHGDIHTVFPVIKLLIVFNICISVVSLSTIKSNFNPLKTSGEQCLKSRVTPTNTERFLSDNQTYPNIIMTSHHVTSHRRGYNSPCESERLRLVQSCCDRDSVSASGNEVAAGTLQVTSQMFCRRRGRLEPYGGQRHVTHSIGLTTHTHTHAHTPAVQDSTTVNNMNTGRFTELLLTL